ncbi:MAG: serine/threonine-protein kinase [Myxococcota bacterium]
MAEEGIGTIGPYELIQEIGSGGMAKLYLATKEGIAGFRRAVAIKVVGELLADHPDFITMFLDEARLAARIRHPNVIYTEDLGEADGRHFIVMEYVHGGSVSEMIVKLRELGRRMGPAFAVSIVAAAAEGLHAAHEARGSDGKRLSIVHRDVSPQNVLVSAEGAVKLIDFGVARANQRLHKTLTPGAMKGKLRYMPPEQLESEEDIDRRADVFSLAVVLWEMLAGRRIFGTQSNDEVTEALREGRLPRVGEVAHGIPKGLDEVISQALEHERDKRPESARALRTALLEAVPEAREVDVVERAALIQALFGEVLDVRSKRLSLVGASTVNTREISMAPVKALERWTLPLEAPAETPAPRDSIGTADTLPPPTEHDPMPFKRHALLMLVLFLITVVGIGWSIWHRSSGPEATPRVIAPER